jgi:hypothetical protein
MRVSGEESLGHTHRPTPAFEPSGIIRCLYQRKNRMTWLGRRCHVEVLVDQENSGYL